MLKSYQVWIKSEFSSLFIFWLFIDLHWQIYEGLLFYKFKHVDLKGISFYLDNTCKSQQCFKLFVGYKRPQNLLEKYIEMFNKIFIIVKGYNCQNSLNFLPSRMILSHLDECTHIGDTSFSSDTNFLPHY